MERERALEIVKKHYSPDGVDDTLRRALETLIPELTESKDERIRNEILIYIGAKQDIDLETHNRWCAYLEKQKEQEHPDGCFTCDEYKKGYEAGRLNGFTAGYNKAMKEQKPAEWTEEGEEIKSSILNVLTALHNSYGVDSSAYIEEIRWLKSLRPQPHWKPSEEQIQTLIKIHGNSDMPTQQILGSLITELNNLNKL